MIKKPKTDSQWVMLSLLALVTMFAIYLVYIIWDWAFIHREYYRGRFLITATVEVDGELKSGSSVYEVSYNARRRGGGFGSSPINGARGTMPVIDLGENGILALSFRDGTPYYPTDWIRRGDCDLTAPSSLPTRLIDKKYPGSSDFRGVLKKLIEHEGPLETSIYAPLVTVIDNPKFEKNIITNFCHVDGVVSRRIKAVNIRIEKTEMPMDIEDPYPDISGRYSVWRPNY